MAIHPNCLRNRLWEDERSVDAAFDATLEGDYLACGVDFCTQALSRAIIVGESLIDPIKGQCVEQTPETE